MSLKNSLSKVTSNDEVNFKTTNDISEIELEEFQEQLKGLGSVVDATALRSYLLKNGKIKSITGDKIVLDTPSNNPAFSKKDDTADQVSKMATQSAKSSIDK